MTPHDRTAVVWARSKRARCTKNTISAKRIQIKERDKKRVEIVMAQIDQRENTLVFCANQAHALLIRSLINQARTSKDPSYCHRVTADDGVLGDQHLRDFQDNEKTILTESQKLSTGVDARNVRNIALLRPVNSMIEFKQIIGRGTRLYDGKDYFTIYDFVKGSSPFPGSGMDGESLEPEPCATCGSTGKLDASHRRIKQEQQSSRDNSTPSPGFLNNSKMSSFAR